MNEPHTILASHSAGYLKADSHIACRAAKGLECVFPIWFTQCSHVWFTLAMPCPYHAVLKAMARHGRQKTACGLPTRVQLLLATMQSSTQTVIRSIPILLTTIHTYDCRVVAAHYKKDDLLNCWTSSSDISGYHADFQKDTALSEHGRRTA
jgi:hypothetical protein